MQSNYRRIGDYIDLVDERNKDLSIDLLLGLSISKEFIPSVANIVGTNMANYKIIRKGQFACSIMQVRRDKKIPVALLEDHEIGIISQAYPIFKIKDESELLPQYLMMWFSRPEFDREACFYAVGGVRGSLEWEDFCNMKLPVPSIEKQREMVAEYNTVVNRIKLSEQLNQKLEETAQAIYRRWFVEFEFPISKEQAAEMGKLELEGKPYKSSGGKMAWNEELGMEVPEGWIVYNLGDKCSKIGSGSTPRGGRESYRESGISLIRSMNIHDYNFEAKELAFISSKQAAKLKNVEVLENDILFNITGASVARCTKVPTNVLPARVNQHVAIIRTRDLCYSNYLMSTLCSEENKRRLIGISDSGSTREAITKDDLEKFKIPFPDKTVCIDFDNIFNSLFKHRESLTNESQALSIFNMLLLSKMTKAELEKEREVI
ncbi:restriction endonuclease subunit S [Cyclobacterium xiamenense]|uniref:restriction endonuclease subunit S n=1 Tax=Cyclobacterium xiamenense TaxID=1297121 RepID=UPI0035D0BF9F